MSAHLQGGEKVRNRINSASSEPQSAPHCLYERNFLKGKPYEPSPPPKKKNNFFEFHQPFLLNPQTKVRTCVQCPGRMLGVGDGLRGGAGHFYVKTFLHVSEHSEHFFSFLWWKKLIIFIFICRKVCENNNFFSNVPQQNK